jgi:hypothetical protein
VVRYGSGLFVPMISTFEPSTWRAGRLSLCTFTFTSLILVYPEDISIPAAPESDRVRGGTKVLVMVFTGRSSAFGADERSIPLILTFDAWIRMPYLVFVVKLPARWNSRGYPVVPDLVIR